MKTIKRERQVRLDELLKYVWDKGIKDETFHSSHDGFIHINCLGHAVMYDDCFAIDELFTITEDVEITEDTKLDLVVVDGAKDVYHEFKSSVNRIIRQYEESLLFIYLQNPDGSIGELIWSKESGLVD